MDVVKVTRKAYKVLSTVDKPFMKFGVFRETREKLGLYVESKCFCCDQKFDDNDDIYLVILKGTHNRLFCKECNDSALFDLPKGGEK